jgi:DNA-directed RNA polymerase subunit RPC12/RpoP
MPEEPTSDLALFATIVCVECGAETELMCVGDLDQPPLVTPTLPESLRPRETAAWKSIAAALPAEPAGLPLGAGAIARRVAELGVPEATPEQAALCLVANLIAMRGHQERALALMRLASNVRCPECGHVAPLVENIG